MPADLLLNQEAVLLFKVNTPDSIDCSGGTRTTSLVTTIQKELLCTKSQTMCQAEVITTSNGELFFNLNIGVDTIAILANGAPVSSNQINATLGQKIRLSTALATQLEWRDSDNNTILSTDTAFDYTPTRALTNITVKSGTKCLTGVTLKIIAQQNTNYVIMVRDTAIECSDSFPKIYPTIVTPAGGSAVFAFSDVITPTNCGDKLVRTWTISGTSAQAVQTITKRDTKAPTIMPKNPLLLGFKSGDTLTVNCKNLPLLKVEDMTIMDNCDAAPQKQFYDVALQRGNCLRDNFLQVLHCAWKATDACGNTSVFDIFIKVIDNDTPVLVNIPHDTILQNNSTLPSVPTNIFARDNCDDNPSIAFIETHNNNITTRKWTATDACGHASFLTQNITQILLPAHIIDTVPPDITFISIDDVNNIIYAFGTVYDKSCEAEVFLKKTNVVVKDNFDKTPVVRFDSTVTVKSTICNAAGYLWTKKYTWTASDSSGNTNSKSITFRFIDVVPPIFLSKPADITINFADTIPDVKVIAIDNCTNVKLTLSIQNLTPTLTDSSFLRTWTATDGCNNTSFLTQKITKLAKRDTVATIKNTNCNLFAQNYYEIHAKDCVTPVAFCTPIPSIKLSGYTIFDNDNVFNGRPTTCADNVQLSLDVRNHTLIIRSNDTARSCADTVTVNVYCTPTPPTPVQTPKVYKANYTIPVNTTATVCLNELIPIGLSKIFRNICSDTSNLGVSLKIISDTCLTIIGKIAGQNTVCITLCDDTGNPCDTLFIQFLVTSQRIAATLLATNDTATTHINTSVDIYILRNDSTVVQPADLAIMSQPYFGQVRIVTGTKPSSEQYLQYLPNTDFCSSVKSDVFYYRICANGKCVQASVTVRTLCDKITIYNGFSPNGDGRNDVFLIEGLQDHPNTKVTIYNRWGTQMYQSNDYKNDWGGKWHGDNIPDGTYFYQIILESGDVYIGYLQIQR